MGDPAGVGPEVLARLPAGPWIVVGSAAALHRYRPDCLAIEDPDGAVAGRLCVIDPMPRLRPQPGKSSAALSRTKLIRNCNSRETRRNLALSSREKSGKRGLSRAALLPMGVRMAMLQRQCGIEISPAPGRSGRAIQCNT